MRAASPPRQIERENEMIVISHRLFACYELLDSLRKFIVAREIEWVKASVLMMGHGVRAHVSRAASPEFPVFHSCFEG